MARTVYNHEKRSCKVVKQGPVSEDYPLQVGEPSPPRVFLLSPANTSALRGQLLLNTDSQFELANRIRRRHWPAPATYHSGRARLIQAEHDGLVRWVQPGSTDAIRR